MTIARVAVEQLQARVLARACAPIPEDRVPLVLGGRVCGRLDPLVATGIACSVPGFHLVGKTLELDRDGPEVEDRTRRLGRAARWLLEVGYVLAWRDEAIDVHAEDDAAVVARIDRCAVRALGLTTHSVRLNGYAADGRLWVARRAAHKRVDPGLWDNLAGGLQAAGESWLEALAREAEEEAGIQFRVLDIRGGGQIRVCRDLEDGLLREVVHVFDLDLPDGTEPVNGDGEVQGFELWELPQVLEGINAGSFTVEASLAILDSLVRRLPAEA